MAEMHLSERLMHLMRERDDAAQLIDGLPKDGVKWALREALDHQMQAVRESMASAWITCNRLKTAAKELNELLPKSGRTE
jgi:hypothetical protein